MNLFGEIPYAEMQSMIDDPPGKRNWWTAEYLTGFPDDAIDRFCAYSERMPNSFTQSLAIAWGGTPSRPTRTRRHCSAAPPGSCTRSASGRAPSATQEHIAWGREGRQALADHKTGATYLNFVGDEGADRVRASFGENYDRLAAIKASWDPDNVFRGNQNIVPASAVA